MNLQRETKFHSIMPSSQNFSTQSSTRKEDIVLSNSNNAKSFLPNPDDTRAYQELYPGFIEKMIVAFEMESEHRRNLEKETAQHKKMMSEKLVESQLINQKKSIEIEVKEQRHQHIKFYIALLVGLIVFFSSYWIKIENKFAFIGLYILLAVIGISPKNFFFKKDKIEPINNNKIHI